MPERKWFRRGQPPPEDDRDDLSGDEEPLVEDQSAETDESIDPSLEATETGPETQDDVGPRPGETSDDEGLELDAADGEEISSEEAERRRVELLQRHKPKHRAESSWAERRAERRRRKAEAAAAAVAAAAAEDTGSIDETAGEGAEALEDVEDADPSEEVYETEADEAEEEPLEPARVAEEEAPEVTEEPEVEEAQPPAPPTRPPGPRRAALQERKTRTRTTQERGLFLSIVAAIVVIGVVALVARQVTSSNDEPDPVSTVAPERLETLLIVGTRQGKAGAKDVMWLDLLTYNTADKRGAVVYVPAHTAVEVPGRGLQTLKDAMHTGGLPLLLVSTENLLGVRLDGFIELSDSDARILFRSTGQLTIDVPTEVRVGIGNQRARVIFGEGLQVIPPDRLAALLYTVGLEKDDIEMGTRHVAFWHALFEAFSADPGNLENALRGAGSILGETEQASEKHIELLSRLARLADEDRSLAPLPVHPLEVEGDRLYVTDETEVSDFVRDVVGQDDDARQVVRVQILNGRNDAPGIGQEVASKLIEQGYNVILTGNAPRFNYKHTLIILYDSTPSAQAVGQRTKELLGVGKVQISTQDQGIVDLTVVVGKDFQRAR